MTLLKENALLFQENQRIATKIALLKLGQEPAAENGVDEDRIALPAEGHMAVQ